MSFLRFLGLLCLVVGGSLAGVALGFVMHKGISPVLEKSIQQGPPKRTIEDLTDKFELPEYLKGCRVFHLQGAHIGDNKIVCNN